MKNLISICIPTHDMSNQNEKMLRQLLDSIIIQSYINYEVIISDQSSTDILKKVCKEYKAKYDIKIKWLDNREGTRASAANINNAIINAKGEYVKPMFLDDLFLDKNALKVLIKEIKNYIWIACGCFHYREDIKKLFRSHEPTIPAYKETEKENMKALALGENLIGCPSVIMYKRTEILFDNPLKMLTDTDLYYRLYLKYGMPKMINNLLILVRIWEESQQNLCSKELIIKEENYIKSKIDLLG